MERFRWQRDKLTAQHALLLRVKVFISYLSLLSLADLPSTWISDKSHLKEIKCYEISISLQWKGVVCP
ncbi:MAG: hypothetical protein R6T98_04070 [Desulfatiglandales bacterium]